MELKEWMMDYCHDVMNGNIVACEKHKWACQRFINDIQREGTEEFPYLFDEEKAMHFLNWMSCFKHTKGVLQGQSIVPHEIQVFIFSNVYGWIHKDTGLRRFRKMYWQVGRKNAKSQSLACVASYEAMALGENMSEVYIGATKTEQSKIVWNEIKAQLKGSDFFNGKYKVAYGKIEHLKSDSFITALSKDAGKTGDGFNVQCAILDEFHAHTDSSILDVLVSGTGARSQPLTIIITTAGFNLSHPCYSVEYKYVSQILNPDVDIFNEEYFVMVNELDKNDSIKEIDNLVKANPILASYEEGRKYLLSEMKAATDVKEKLRGFLTKNCNVWIEMRDNGYLEMSRWKKCEDDYALEDLRGLPCVVGVDLSTKNDLTSVTFLFAKDDYLYVHNHSFLPEETLPEKISTGKVPYDLWIQEGWITSIPGAVVDFEFVEVYIEEIAKQYEWNVKEIISDPWQAMYFMQNMDKKGFTVVEARQGYQTLSLPTKDFRERVYSGKVKHNSNSVLTWSISNAVVRVDANFNEQLDKSKSSEKIDPIASLINAHIRTFTLENGGDDLNDHILSDDFTF